MQNTLTRAARLVVPALIVFLFVAGCGGNQTDPIVVTKIDSLAEKVRLIDGKLDVLQRDLFTPSSVLFTGKKRQRVHLNDAPARKKVIICVQADFNSDVKFDSLAVHIVGIKKNGKSTVIGDLTFSKRFVDNARIVFNEPKEFDMVITSVWYPKKTGTPEIGEWCESGPNCNITVKCSDLSGTVVTSRTSSTGGSTATVSVDEQ